MSINVNGKGSRQRDVDRKRYEAEYMRIFNRNLDKLEESLKKEEKKDE